jgi:hypothetical protein
MSHPAYHIAAQEKRVKPGGCLQRPIDSWQSAWRNGKGFRARIHSQLEAQTRIGA